MKTAGTISNHQYSRRSLLFSLLALSLCCLPNPLLANRTILAEQELEKLEQYDSNSLDDEFNLAWESRYVSEGRDNLDGSSIVSTTSQFKLRNFYIIPWLGYNHNKDFLEIDLTVLYEISLTSEITGVVGYNHIYERLQGESNNDDEINIDLSYQWLENVELTTSLYHSFLTKGAFIEAAANTEFTFNHSQLGFEWLLGANAGYIPDGHNGLNHSRFQINATNNPTDRLELFTYVAYNVAINRDTVNYTGDETLKNFFWGGIGLVYQF